MTSTGEEDTTRLWHMRLGHPVGKALQGLVSQGLLKGVKSFNLDSCEHCVLGKQTRVKFASEVHKTEGFFYCIHANVWGPTKVTSLDGNKWFEIGRAHV